MCPRAAADRPAVLPMFVHSLSWKHDREDLSLPLERRTARQFSVLGWDGRRVGVFSVAGPAEVSDGDAAIGSYAGGSPCEKPRQGEGPAELYGDCVVTQRHCGLAVSVLEPPGLGARPIEEDPDPVSLPVADVCLAKDLLLVDVDGDGKREAFTAADFLDGMRSPADEVLAVSGSGAKCDGTFARRNAIPPGDPRDWQGMDILGVVDLDGDGRTELVAVYRYADKRTWALYSPIGSAARLELVAESVPWSVR